MPLFHPLYKMNQENRTNIKPIVLTTFPTVPVSINNSVVNQVGIYSHKDCSKLLYDYIKCINDDEICCAELYQKYINCANSK